MACPSHQLERKVSMIQEEPRPSGWPLVREIWFFLRSGKCQGILQIGQGNFIYQESRGEKSGNFIILAWNMYFDYLKCETKVCLSWGLTSQSTIFQSCRDGATASWVINQYFRGVKCLAQGHNTAAVGLEPPTSRSGVRHWNKSVDFF